MSDQMEYVLKQPESNVVVARFDNVSSGWEQWVMLSADRHHDSPLCNRRLEKKHLDKCKERKALIVDAGDLFDVMGGHYDPRRSLDGVRDEDVGEDYLDRVVYHTAEDYREYASHFLVLARGNHETSVRKHNSTDLTQRLADRLNDRYGGRCCVGGYGGWVKFVFRVNGTKSQSYNLKYYHGGGGGNAPVTKGVIETSRQAVYLPDADVVLNGHNHEGYHLGIARERLTIHGNIRRDVVDFVRVPGYKDVWGIGRGELGFEAERGAPRPTGCAWIRFYYVDGMVRKQVELDIE